MSQNQVTELLQYALEIFNERTEEMMELVTMSPESFRGGAVWEKARDVFSSMTAVGYALLTLFFLAGVLRSGVTMEGIRRPEASLRLLIRFAVGKLAVECSGELLGAFMKITQGISLKLMASPGASGVPRATLPAEIVSEIEKCTLLQEIPLFAVALIAFLVIWYLSLKMLLCVYGRFFRIYLYLIIAPLPLSGAAGEGGNRYAVSFLRSFACVCLEGVTVTAALVLFSIFASSVPLSSAGKSAFMMAVSYMGSVIFDMLILNTLIRSSDTVTRELFM